MRGYSYMEETIIKNFIFGYARVSTEQQNLDRQIDALNHYGVDTIYNEKMTGTKRERPELNKMLERMTQGDTVVIESLSAWQEYERDCIADRPREGLKAARTRGRKGGRSKANPEAVKKAVKLYGTRQYSIQEIEELTGVKKATLYRNL